MFKVLWWRCVRVYEYDGVCVCVEMLIFLYCTRLWIKDYSSLWSWVKATECEPQKGRKEKQLFEDCIFEKITERSNVC